MRFTSGKSVLAAAAMAAFSATSAMAATTLNVPFDFTAAGKNCPAGSYSVERRPLDAFVTLKSKDGRKSFSWYAGPGDVSPTDTRVVLRFDAQDGNHTLHSVQYRGMVTPNLNKGSKHAEHMPVETIQGQGQ